MPAYISVEEAATPACKDRSCEQGEHWVRVEIGPAILEPVEESIDAMYTALGEIEAEIEMDSEGPDAPTLLIKAARGLRAAIKGAERMVKAVKGRKL